MSWPGPLLGLLLICELAGACKVLKVDPNRYLRLGLRYPPTLRDCAHFGRPVRRTRQGIVTVCSNFKDE